MKGKKDDLKGCRLLLRPEMESVIRMTPNGRTFHTLPFIVARALTGYFCDECKKKILQMYYGDNITITEAMVWKKSKD